MRTEDEAAGDVKWIAAGSSLFRRVEEGRVGRESKVKCMSLLEGICYEAGRPIDQRRDGVEREAQASR